MKVRAVVNKGDFALVPLTKGYFATIDVEDIHKVEKYNWSASERANGLVYAVRGYRDSGKQTTVYMHRALFTDEAEEIDHINGDGLYNRKENLRAANHPQNNHNKGRYINNKSGYKGVSWNKLRGYYQVFITSYGEKKYLGSFSDPAVGHEAFTKAANDLHEKFARTA